jgi:uncharacterized protein (DUF169 family)
MSNYTSLAQTLTRMLGLEHPPVAVAPVAAVPKGVPIFEGVSPSACSFWRNAEKEVFAARDADHMNCPIGAMVMGFELTPEAKEGLGRAFEMMCGLGYVNPREAEHIPKMAKKGEIFLYGPLSHFPIEPEVLVLWLLPSQAMLLREATGEAEWGSPFLSTVYGRPACAALAVASEGAPAVASFGCIGMRTFTGIEPSYMLAALSGRLLPTLEVSLQKIHQANGAMQAYYDQQKSAFPFMKRGEQGQ